MGWVRRVHNTVFNQRLGEQFREEAQSFFDELVREGMRNGFTKERAERDAQLLMGNLALAQDEIRDADTLRWLDELVRDIRRSLRQLRKSPGFTAVAVLTLTLGIGANTAIFTVLHGLMFRDLNVRKPQQLMQLSIQMRNGAETGLSVPAWRQIEQDSRELFSSFVVWTSGLRLAELDGEPFPANVWMVSGNFHSELATTPALGRLLTPADANLDTVSGQTVAVLGYAFWQRRFGGEPSIVGRTIRIEGVPFTIVGVTAPSFRGISRTQPPELTVPFTAQPLIVPDGFFSWTKGNIFWVNVMARRRDGITADQARASLTAAWPNILATTMPPEFSGVRRDNFLAIRLVPSAVVDPVERLLRRQLERPLVVVMGIALFVLLIACLNLAGLMLTRTLRREREIGAMMALGATRWRIARHVLIEALIVSLAGGVLGIVAAPSLCGGLARFLLSNRIGETASLDTTPDAVILAIAASLTIAAPLIFSAAPAWYVMRRQSLALLQGSAQTRNRSGRLGRALVAGQLALCLVLLVDAGLLVRTLTELRSLPLGFATDDVFAAVLAPRRGGAQAQYDPAYVPALLTALKSRPGVTFASLSWNTPGSVVGPPEFVSDLASMSGDEVASTYNAVSPEFFRVLRLPLLQGREFTTKDVPQTEPVAIVSRALASRLFHDSDPVDRYIRIGVFPHRQRVRVVGVVGDARIHDVKDANVYAAYMPLAQDPRDSGCTLLLRGTGISEADIARTIGSLDRDYVARFESLDDVRDRALLDQRLAALVAQVFGVLALALAAIGVYALMAYEVADRTKELGIRMALGATRRAILKTVLARGGAAILVGIVVGLSGAWAGARVVQALLIGVTPHDRLTFEIATLAMTSVATVASVLPATRAARVDVNEVLRSD